jgi:hypothetical protein
MLGTAMVMRLTMVAIGALFCIFDFVSYSRQKLTDKFAFLWGIFGVGIILAGALPVLSGWTELFDSRTYFVAVLLFLVVLSMLYSMSRAISELTRKNQELAVQVSLLNNENEQMIDAVHALLEKEEQEKLLGDDLSWIKRRRYS